MESKEARAIRLLADVVGSQIRKQTGCNKLQCTPYGHCEGCPQHTDCHTIHVIKEGQW